MSDPFLKGMLNAGYGILPDQQKVSIIRNVTTLGTGVTATQRPLSYKDMQAVGVLELTDIAATFLIQLSSYSGPEIHQRDIIVDENGNTWVIGNGSVQMDNTTFRAVCIRLRGT